MECKTNTCEPKPMHQKSCGSEKKSGCCLSGCQMTDGIIKMAEEAWGMAVKERMKQHFEKTAGEKLDKIAQAGVKASMTLWQNKIKEKMAMQQEFENIQKTMKD